MGTSGVELFEEEVEVGMEAMELDHLVHLIVRDLDRDIFSNNFVSLGSKQGPLIQLLNAVYPLLILKLLPILQHFLLLLLIVLHGLREVLFPYLRPLLHVHCIAENMVVKRRHFVKATLFLYV